MVLNIVSCFLFLKSFQFACISVIIKKHFKESNSSSLSKVLKSIETYEREEGHCTRGNKRLPRGTKRLGLALLPLTLNCLWNSQSQGFPEGIDWRWETSFVTLLRNIKHRLQRKGHREPVQLGLRLWKKTAQLSPCQARQLQEALLAFLNFGFSMCKWEQVRNCIIGGLPWWDNG